SEDQAAGEERPSVHVRPLAYGPTSIGAASNRAMRPSSPTAQPASGPAKPTAWNPSSPRLVQVSPPSSDRSLPVGPTAIRVGPADPGSTATAERYPPGSGPGGDLHVRPPSEERATT